MTDSEDLYNKSVGKPPRWFPRRNHQRHEPFYAAKRAKLSLRPTAERLVPIVKPRVYAPRLGITTTVSVRSHTSFLRPYRAVRTISRLHQSRGGENCIKIAIAILDAALVELLAGYVPRVFGCLKLIADILLDAAKDTVHCVAVGVAIVHVVVCHDFDDVSAGWARSDGRMAAHFVEQKLRRVGRTWRRS